MTRTLSGIWKAFARSSALMKAGIAILLVIIVASIVVPMISTYDPYENTGLLLSGPSSHNWFGTDNLGRDIFVRSFEAARTDIKLAILGVLIALLVGTVVGAFAAMTRFRIVRSVIMLIIAGVNAFPSLVLLMSVIAVMGGGTMALLVAITVSQWTRYATLAEARASIVKQSDFVAALTVLGYRRGRVVLLHILPNVVGEGIAYAVSEFTVVILTIGALSFLGSGVQPPTPEWGAMISAGRLYLVNAPWMTWGPGVLLVLTGLGAALIGESRRRGRYV